MLHLPAPVFERDKFVATLRFLKQFPGFSIDLSDPLQNKGNHAIQLAGKKTCDKRRLTLRIIAILLAKQKQIGRANYVVTDVFPFVYATFESPCHLYLMPR